MVFVDWSSGTGLRAWRFDLIIILGQSFDSELLVSDGGLALSLGADVIKLLAKLDPIKTI